MPTDIEDSENSPSSDLVNNDDHQSTNPVTLEVSASDVHQTSTSATTSLLLDKSSTAVSTPVMQTVTSSWFGARFSSRVLAVVRSVFSFPFSTQSQISTDQGSAMLLENQDFPVGIEFEDPVVVKPETDGLVIQLYTDLSNAIFDACKKKVSEDCPSTEPSPETKAVDDVYQLYADLSNVIFEGCKMKTLSPQSTSSKLEEDSKVPQMESAIQVPTAEVNVEVSVRICGIILEMLSFSSCLIIFSVL